MNARAVDFFEEGEKARLLEHIASAFDMLQGVEKGELLLSILLTQQDEREFVNHLNIV